MQAEEKQDMSNHTEQPISSAQTAMPCLLCVDGNSILNRTFYGIRPLTTRTGIPTNALYGFVNILSRQLQTLQPTYTVCAFDRKAPTFRHKAYEAYKAGRHETPQELLTQFPFAKQCAQALGFHVIEMDGYEADDVLGTCANMAEKENVHTYLLTGDRDALQLISDKTTVLLATNRDTLPFTPETFRETYGIAPAQFVDVKALMGDSSDNIPGVRGIGEKTALKLIGTYHSLSALYENLEDKEIAKGVKEKLTTGKEDAEFSKFLATIVTDAPLGVALKDLKNEGFDKPALHDLLVKLEFSRFLKQLDLETTSGESAAQTDSVQTITVPEVKTCTVAQLPPSGYLSVYVANETCYFSDGTACYAIPVTDILQEQQTVCAQCPRLIVYDAKAFYHFLCTNVPSENKNDNTDLTNKKPSDHGAHDTVEKATDFTTLEITDVAFDVMLAAYCLHPGEKYELRQLFLQYLHTDAGQAPSGALDAVLLYRLHDVMKAQLKEANMETPLYTDIELPLARVLFCMESTGFHVDPAALKQFGTQLDHMAQELRERIYLAAGDEFNILSPKQLAEVLFDELQLPFRGKKRSTNAEVLEKLRGFHPIVDDILEYRQVTKLKSTYVDGLLKAADKQGRVHTTFQQAVTATGRLSSTEPNLQNIPIRTDLGREMRRFFTTKNSDYVLIDADYSQIELRLLAAISGDETMIQTFLDGTDIHTMTAAQVFGIPHQLVTPQLRKRAKAVNFGIVYGIGDYSLAVDIGVSRKEAGEYISSYLATYPRVAAYLKDVVQRAKEDGYVTTLFGRRRYIPELSSTKKTLQAFGQRVAMNSPIQGSAADIIKMAMIRIARRLEHSHFDARLILQVHDELLIECRRDQAQVVSALMREVMEHTVQLAVPLTVDVQIGDNWYDGH